MDKNFTETTAAKEGEHEYDTGESTWLLACTAIAWIMIPGVGYFYNGMARYKSSLSLSMLCFWTCAVVSIQWYVIGYTLCLSDTGGPLIGNLDHLFLQNANHPAIGNPKVPALLVGVWYGLFAYITPCIIFGGCAERVRILPSAIFVFLWSTFVFDFLTYWTWNANGWTYKLGALDFGGGSPVHISTGMTALAFAIVVGKRTDLRHDPQPHNMSHIVLGTSFIWFGWLVANAGCGLSPNMRAVNTLISTNLSAAVGGITWCTIDYIRQGKWNALGFCTGVVAGLVAITPASGYVSPSSALVFGFTCAIICNMCMGVKHVIKVDDAFDVFSLHGIGGIVGNFLVAIFAQKSVASVDGTVIEGGWLDGNWKQIGIQAVDTIACGSWSFFVSLVLLFVIDKIPGLRLRPGKEEEQSGLDSSELGTWQYGFVEDIGKWSQSDMKRDKSACCGSDNNTIRFEMTNEGFVCDSNGTGK